MPVYILTIDEKEAMTWKESREGVFENIGREDREGRNIVTKLHSQKMNKKDCELNKFRDFPCFIDYICSWKILYVYKQNYS